MTGRIILLNQAINQANEQNETLVDLSNPDLDISGAEYLSTNIVSPGPITIDQILLEECKIQDIQQKIETYCSIANDSFRD